MPRGVGGGGGVGVAGLSPPGSRDKEGRGREVNWRRKRASVLNSDPRGSLCQQERRCRRADET